MILAGPARPKSANLEDLGFTPQPMVRWFDPRELTGTALRVLLSGVFGTYSDKRELQAGLVQTEPLDYSDRPELWIDYVADLGDGFDSTMTVASVLAEEKLDPGLPRGNAFPTRRGDVLIMGGDQVYPTATKEQYENRMIGPYKAALPYTESDHPELYAIPGNHDWYDGLTSFMRIFCQRSWLGGWRTRQSRSYFALQLPQRWWLWGIDVQFDSYIDTAQLEYFQQIAATRVQEGDGIILCSAEPSWVDANDDEPDAYHTLDYLERTVILPRGAEVRLSLAGDTHHYARYAEVDGSRQKITAGGGGAYLAATHHLPAKLQIPPPETVKRHPDADVAHYQLSTSYPNPHVSKSLVPGVFTLPWKNPTFWALLGFLYLLFGWTVLAAVRGNREGLVDLARRLAFPDLLVALPRSPVALLLTTGLFFALFSFTKSHVRWKRFPIGGVHATCHVLGILAVVRLTAGVLPELPDVLYGFAFVASVSVVGGLLGSWLVALYLFITDLFHCNTNELFSCQRIENHKNFLRMHVDESGTLTVYPIGIQRVCRNWKLKPEGRPGDPWFEPEPSAAPRPQLIEAPIRIPRLAEG